MGVPQILFLTILMIEFCANVGRDFAVNDKHKYIGLLAGTIIFIGKALILHFGGFWG